MEYIQVTEENLEREHICCAISNNKDIQVSSKKAWLADRFRDGLVFLKSAERGKCFIEYIPAENAWVPIEAEGYMYIDCLWVAGSLKGHGYATDLMDRCISDSREKGKKGLCILSSAKKRGFLADPKYLAHRGFSPCDESDCGVQLWYLPLQESVQPPKFKECARYTFVNEAGFVLYYTNQCPFTAKYVPIVEQMAKERGVEFRSVRLDSREKAQNAPTPTTTYTLFRDGKYITNEIQSDKKFQKMMEG